MLCWYVSRNMIETQEKTKLFWSKSLAAALYRRFAGRRFSKMHAVVAEQVASRQPRDILDIACGRGDFLFRLSNRLLAAHLTGTDVAPGMVEHAKKKLAGRALIVEADGAKQPFPENSFDIATVMMAFHHFPEKDLAVRNIRKILKPDGVLIIVDVVAGSNFQKKLWNFSEKVINIRGYVGHYTETEIKEIADRNGYVGSCERMPGVAGRYRICFFVP